MENQSTSPQVIEAIKNKSATWLAVKQEIKKVIVGQDAIIERAFIGLLCNGHLLLEGVPGLAKTTLIKTISQAIGLQFSRIQFTPDLLPADLLGTLIYNPKTQEFQTRKGPIFTNLLLADEINRAPAKVQSALLECMQERQVTIGDTTFKLDNNFLVLATQNPIDQEGTYRLPEAQVDRFMFKLLMHYPSYEEEKLIISKSFHPLPVLKSIEPQEILEHRELINSIYVDEKVIEYILNIVFATRNPNDYQLDDISSFIEYGASPRASIAINQAIRAHAFLRRRHFVTPDDVKAIVPDILRHRIMLTYEAEADNVTTDQVIQQILRIIPSP